MEKWLINFRKVNDLKKQDKTIIFFEEHLITPHKDAGSLSIFNFAKLFQSIGFKVLFHFKFFNIYSNDFNLLQKNGFHIITEVPDLNLLDIYFSNNHITPYIFYITRPEYYSASHKTLKKKFSANVFFIYDTIDLHFLRLKRQHKITGLSDNYKQINEYERIEISNIKKSNLTIIRSSYEINLLKKSYNINESRLLNLSLLFKERDKLKKFADTEGLVFVANFNHLPNIDSLIYFFNEISPHLSSRFNNINFYIVGKGGEYHLKKMIKKSTLNIVFEDFVEDLHTFLGERRVNIAPLRFGAGIKGKVAQALVNGLPTVSTSIGFEGMSRSIKSKYSANNPKMFADLMFSLYFDKDSWRKAQFEILNFSKIWSIGVNKKLLVNKLKAKKIILPNKGMKVELI